MAVAWIAVHNTAPEAVNDEYYVLAGSAVRGNVLANDTDADGDSLRVVKINDQPPRQLMRLPSAAQLVMNPNGDFVYYAVERSDAPHTGDDSFTYTVSDGVAEATQTVVVWTAKVLGVEWMTFRGGHVVHEDPRLDNLGVREGIAYEAEHGLDTNLDGVAEYTLPYAYNRSTQATPSKLQVESRLVLSMEWRGGPIWVRASATDGIRIDPVQVRVNPMDRTKLDLPVTTSANDFPSVVKAYVGANLFTINWQATSDSDRAEATWSNVGVTHNPLYLTFDSPNLAIASASWRTWMSNRLGFDTVKLYHTLVHLGSTAASGESTRDKVVEKVWDMFKARTVSTHTGQKLHYYNSYLTQSRLTPELLAYKDGTSDAWVKFFLDVLKAQGIRWENNYLRLRPDLNKLGFEPTWGLPAIQGRDYGFLMKAWDFQAQPAAANAIVREPNSPVDILITQRGFSYLNVISTELPGDPTRQVGYEWRYADVTDIGAPAPGQGNLNVVGQNNPNPASYLLYHDVVQINMGNRILWLDPSYGLAYEGETGEQRLLDFENKTISAYYLLAVQPVREEAIAVDLNGNQSQQDIVAADVLLIRKNIENQRETIITGHDDY
jgi:hypothetical protein